MNEEEYANIKLTTNEKSISEFQVQKESEDLNNFFSIQEKSLLQNKIKSFFDERISNIENLTENYYKKLEENKNIFYKEVFEPLSSILQEDFNVNIVSDYIEDNQDEESIDSSFDCGLNESSVMSTSSSIRQLNNVKSSPNKPKMNKILNRTVTMNPQQAQNLKNINSKQSTNTVVTNIKKKINEKEDKEKEKLKTSTINLNGIKQSRNKDNPPITMRNNTKNNTVLLAPGFKAKLDDYENPLTERESNNTINIKSAVANKKPIKKVGGNLPNISKKEKGKEKEKEKESEESNSNFVIDLNSSQKDNTINLYSDKEAAQEASYKLNNVNFNFNSKNMNNINININNINNISNINQGGEASSIHSARSSSRKISTSESVGHLQVTNLPENSELTRNLSNRNFSNTTESAKFSTLNLSNLNANTINNINNFTRRISQFQITDIQKNKKMFSDFLDNYSKTASHQALLLLLHTKFLNYKSRFSLITGLNNYKSLLKNLVIQKKKDISKEITEKNNMYEEYIKESKEELSKSFKPSSTALQALFFIKDVKEKELFLEKYCNNSTVESLFKFLIMFVFCLVKNNENEYVVAKFMENSSNSKSTSSSELVKESKENDDKPSIIVFYDLLLLHYKEKQLSK